MNNSHLGRVRKTGMSNFLIYKVTHHVNQYFGVSILILITLYISSQYTLYIVPGLLTYTASTLNVIHFLIYKVTSCQSIFRRLHSNSHHPLYVLHRIPPVCPVH
uniref:Uncharacterized protein n=1 Tax=Cacopsylla melanoneura TaxID=428564 RepID=A0A8D9AIH4_9HEMI